MIELIDQTDRNRHIYRCDLCKEAFVAPTPARSQSHVCGKADPMLLPVTVAVPVVAPAPAVKRGRKPKAPLVPEPAVPVKRARKSKAGPA
jgi:hypothetical protein